MDLELRVAYGLLQVPANALSQDAVVITEVRITPKDDGWLVMLKGERRGKKLIAWVHGPTWKEALRGTTTSLDSGHISWQTERPPPWRR